MELDAAKDDFWDLHGLVLVSPISCKLFSWNLKVLAEQPNRYMDLDQLWVEVLVREPKPLS